MSFSICFQCKMKYTKERQQALCWERVSQFYQMILALLIREARLSVRFGRTRWREDFLCKFSLLWISRYKFSGWIKPFHQSSQRIKSICLLGCGGLWETHFPLSQLHALLYLSPPIHVRWQNQAKWSLFLSLVLFLLHRLPSSEA